MNPFDVAPRGMFFLASLCKHFSIIAQEQRTRMVRHTARAERNLRKYTDALIVGIPGKSTICAESTPQSDSASNLESTFRSIGDSTSGEDLSQIVH